MYDIEVYLKEDLICQIFVGQVITFKNYSDEIIHLPFGIKSDKEIVSVEELEEFFQERCFPEERENCKQILKELDIPFYDPELICRKTHGQQFDDFVWLQFSDEEQVRYEDIKLRD